MTKSKQNTKDKIEYAELNKLVKTKELIQELLEARKGPRQINKHRNDNEHEKRMWRNYIRQRRHSKNG